MPILQREVDIYPSDLFEKDDLTGNGEKCWWSFYTLSRREKELARRLIAKDIPFYAPVIPKRTKSPQGRIRTSHVPLFSNYVFAFGDEMQRYEAQKSGCISRHMRVVQDADLVRDLRQIHNLIMAGVPLAPEARFQPGREVRVRSGPFRGYEGIILRREGQTRLLVAVKFLQQGASMELDGCEIEYLDSGEVDRQ
jgi:transcription antitermination factor NusG